jgi:hypothetical protein
MATPTQALRAGKTPIGKLEHGVGFNWFDETAYGLPDKDAQGYPVCPDLNDHAGWAAITDALDDLRPGVIRFWLNPDQCVGEKPAQVKTTAVCLQRASQVAAWAEKNDCTILLDTVNVPAKYQFQPSSTEVESRKTNPWVYMAARDNNAFAKEYVTPLLKHLLLEKNLQAVRLYNAYNEPLQYGPFTTPGNVPDAFVHYVDMYRAIQSALKSAGLYPSRIRLAGVEAIHPSGFPVLDFTARGVDIDPYIDVYTIHYYFHRFDWMAPVPFLPYSFEETFDRATPKIIQYCKKRGKPLLAAEIGWYPNDNDPQPMPTDPLAQSRDHAAITVAETMIRGMNAGLSGFGIWTLLSSGLFDGAWRVVWVHDGKLYKAEHLYPTYRLFSRYARPGSDVYPLGPEVREWPWQYVHGTALLTPGDKAVVYLLNDHLVESRKVHVTLPGNWAGRRLKRVVKDSARLGTSTGAVELKANGSSALVEDLLTPMSLTAFLEEECGSGTTNNEGCISSNLNSK